MVSTITSAAEAAFMFCIYLEKDFSFVPFHIKGPKSSRQWTNATANLIATCIQVVRVKTRTRMLNLSPFSLAQVFAPIFEFHVFNSFPQLFFAMLQHHF